MRIEDTLAGDSGSCFAWAYRFATDGRASTFQPDASFRLERPDDGFIWLHANLADARVQDWIAGATEIPAAARQTLLTLDEHQQLDAGENCIWGVMADLVLDMEEVTQTVGYMHFVLGEHFLISARRHPLQATQNTRLLVDGGKLMSVSSQLFQSIVERVLAAITDIVVGLIRELEAIEDRVLDDIVNDERQSLGPIRRKALRLHRQLEGLRNIFRRLDQKSDIGLPAHIRTSGSQLLQKIESLHQEVHSIHDRARLLQEESAQQLANKTNDNLFFLTIVSALLLPPTLITGMFGMNVKGMLFADDENGYIYAMTMCVVSSLLVLWWMRRAGMLK